MNLSTATLIPFKTKARDNQGRIWTYIGRSTALRYRFGRVTASGTSKTESFSPSGSIEMIGGESIELVTLGEHRSRFKVSQTLHSPGDSINVWGYVHQIDTNEHRWWRATRCQVISVEDQGADNVHYRIRYLDLDFWVHHRNTERAPS